MDVLNKILKLLEQSGVEYKHFEHEPVRTSEEAAKIRGVSLSSGAKAMVVKSKNQFSLIVLPADKRIDWKKLKKILGTDVRFATEEEAEKITSVKVGGIPPFGNILGLPTIYDHAILDQEIINFNIGSKTHSVTMKSTDLVKLVNPQLISVIKK